MEPTKWGNYGWGFIHNVALGYPTDISYMLKEQYRIFFESFGDVLPCVECSKHYKQLIAKTPPDFTNKDTLFKWTVDIHNQTNHKLNKKTITYENAYNIWLHNKDIIRKKNNYNYKPILFLGIFIIFIMFIIFIILGYYIVLKYSAPLKGS